MKMQGVKSSNIAAIGHRGNTLRVQFKNGSIYEYQGVSQEQHTDLMAAKSLGAHLAKMGVKGKKI